MNCQPVPHNHPARVVNAGHIVHITAAAHASATTITGTTVHLAASGVSSDGSKLTYTWSIVQSPGTALRPTFSANGKAAASKTVATFHRDGRYTFRCTIRDAQGHAVTSDVSVVVKDVATRLRYRSEPGSIAIGDSTDYRADVYDQFGRTLRTQPAIRYSIEHGPGTYDSVTGKYRAPDDEDTAELIAHSGNLSDRIHITIYDPNDDTGGVGDTGDTGTSDGSGDNTPTTQPTTEPTTQPDSGDSGGDDSGADGGDVGGDDGD